MAVPEPKPPPTPEEEYEPDYIRRATPDFSERSREAVNTTLQLDPMAIEDVEKQARIRYSGNPAEWARIERQLIVLYDKASEALERGVSVEETAKQTKRMPHFRYGEYKASEDFKNLLSRGASKVGQALSYLDEPRQLVAENVFGAPEDADPERVGRMMRAGGRTGTEDWKRNIALGADVFGKIPAAAFGALGAAATYPVEAWRTKSLSEPLKTNWSAFKDMVQGDFGGDFTMGMLMDPLTYGTFGVTKGVSLVKSAAHKAGAAAGLTTAKALEFADRAAEIYSKSAGKASYTDEMRALGREYKVPFQALEGRMGEGLKYAGEEGLALGFPNPLKPGQHVASVQLPYMSKANLAKIPGVQKGFQYARGALKGLGAIPPELGGEHAYREIQSRLRQLRHEEKQRYLDNIGRVMSELQQIGKDIPLERKKQILAEHIYAPVETQVKPELNIPESGPSQGQTLGPDPPMFKGFSDEELAILTRQSSPSEDYPGMPGDWLPPGEELPGEEWAFPTPPPIDRRALMFRGGGIPKANQPEITAPTQIPQAPPSPSPAPLSGPAQDFRLQHTLQNWENATPEQKQEVLTRYGQGPQAELENELRRLQARNVDIEYGPPNLALGKERALNLAQIQALQQQAPPLPPTGRTREVTQIAAPDALQQQSLERAGARQRERVTRDSTLVTQPPLQHAPDQDLTMPMRGEEPTTITPPPEERTRIMPGDPWADVPEQAGPQGDWFVNREIAEPAGPYLPYEEMAPHEQQYTDLLKGTFEEGVNRQIAEGVDTQLPPRNKLTQSLMPEAIETKIQRSKFQVPEPVQKKVDDPDKLLASFQKGTERAISTARHERWIADTFGGKGDTADPVMLRNSKGEDVPIDRQLFDKMMEMHDEAFSSFKINLLDKGLNIWKQVKLFGSLPAYMLNNMSGDLFLMYNNGLKNGFRFSEAQKLWSQGSNSRLVSKVAGMTHKDAQEFLKKHGIGTGTGMADVVEEWPGARDLRGALSGKKPTDLKQTYLDVATAGLQRAGSKWANWWDRTAKTALWLEHVNRGMSPEEALREVFKVLPDYGDVDKVGRLYRQFAPFGSWQYKMLANAPRTMLRSPAGSRMLYTGQQSMPNITYEGKDEQGSPASVTMPPDQPPAWQAEEGVTIPYPLPEGRQMSIRPRESTIESMAAKSGIGPIAKSMRPELKALVEAGFDIDTFTGKKTQPWEWSKPFGAGDLPALAAEKAFNMEPGALQADPGTFEIPEQPGWFDKWILENAAGSAWPMIGDLIKAGFDMGYKIPGQDLDQRAGMKVANRLTGLNPQITSPTTEFFNYLNAPDAQKTLLRKNELKQLLNKAAQEAEKNKGAKP